MFQFSRTSAIVLAGLSAIAGANLFTAPASSLSVAKSPTVRPQTIKVFFPKNPQQQQNLGYVEPVWRQPQTMGLAQFAVTQLISGPTPQERQRGLVAPIRLRGASTCGQDFTLAIAAGVARLQFCRQVVSAGVGDDARLLSSVNATLKQFSTLRSIVVLDQNGNCLGDMSGENRCLRR